MNSADQSVLLQNHLRDLVKFRAQTATLYQALQTQVKEARDKSRKREEKLLKDADKLGFVIECIVGLAALSKAAAAGVKLTGDALKAANAAFLKQVAKHAGGNVYNIGEMVWDPDGWFEVAANCFSFTFWMNRATVWLTKKVIGDVDTVFQEISKGLERDLTNAITRIDDDIKLTSSWLKIAAAGIDVSAVA